MNNYLHKIQLAGDWAPCERDVETLFNSPAIILNIEGPVLTHGTSKFVKQKKAGPTIFNRAFPMFSQFGIAVMANNHIMDYGHSGLVETLNTFDHKCNSRGWHCLGAGFTNALACKPLVLEDSGLKIAFLSRCETQFGIASSSRTGVAAFDSTIYQQIHDLKKKVDIVIVSIHAAAEMVPWPSPRRQLTWRSLIDAGASVIHGHHAHVPQGWEEYNGGLIFYGLGNFCVDPQKWSWHPQGLWSFVPELDFTDGVIKVKIATTVIDELGNSILVREANGAEHNEHMAYLDECNRPLYDPILLEGLWQEASVLMYHHYFAKWLGFNSRSFLEIGASQFRAKISAIKRGLMEGGSQSEHPMNLGKFLLWYHLFACDSHNDAIGTALGVLSGELEDRRNKETARLANEWIVLDS